MDQRAWLEALYTRYHADVFRFALSILRERTAAEDVTQEAFLKAYRSFGTYRAQGRERAWLFQIARRTAYDHLRRASRELPWEAAELSRLSMVASRSSWMSASVYPASSAAS